MEKERVILVLMLGNLLKKGLKKKGRWKGVQTKEKKSLDCAFLKKEAPWEKKFLFRKKDSLNLLGGPSFLGP